MWHGDYLDIKTDAELLHDVLVRDADGRPNGFTWRWVGGKVASVGSVELMLHSGKDKVHRGTVHHLDSIRVKVVGFGSHLCCYVMRDGWKATVWRPLYRVLAFLQEIARRVLWTLVIWRIVHHDIPTEPKWSDFRPLRWWRQRRQRKAESCGCGCGGVGQVAGAVYW